MSAILIVGLLLCFLCSLSSGLIQFTSKKIEETEIDIITHESWDLTGKENVNDVLENETGTSMLKFLQFMGAIKEGDACNKDRQESGNFLLDHHTKIKGKVDSSENVDTSC